MNRGNRELRLFDSSFNETVPEEYRSTSSEGAAESSPGRKPGGFTHKEAEPAKLAVEDTLYFSTSRAPAPPRLRIFP